MEAHLGGAVVVGVRHAEPAGRQRLEHLFHARDARDREGALRRAVVSDRARDDLVLHGLAGELEVLLRELPRRLDGFAAARREEDAVEVAGRVVGETVGELDRGRVGVRPQREERELFRLLAGCLGEALAAVAHLHDEEAREAVDVLLAVRVVDVVALAAHDDGHAVAGLHARLAGEVHPEVVFRLLLQVGLGRGVEGGARRGDGGVDRHRVLSRVVRRLGVRRGRADRRGRGLLAENTHRVPQL